MATNTQADIEGNAPTARQEGRLIAGPRVGFGESEKLTFAPSMDDASKYLKSKGYRVFTLEDEDGNSIRNEVSDFFLMPPNFDVEPTNENIMKYGTRANTGILGTLGTESARMLGTIGGGILGAGAGAPAGPVGVGTGAIVGAGAGGALVEGGRQALGRSLYDSEEPYDTGEIAKEGAYGATAELGGRYVLPYAGKLVGKVLPTAEKATGKMAEKVGEKLANVAGQGSTKVPVGKSELNIGKFVGGTEKQITNERALLKDTIDEAFAPVIKSAPTKQQNILSKALKDMPEEEADQLFENMYSLAKYDTKGELSTSSKNVMKEELASGMWNKYFGILKQSKTYSDWSPEQLWREVHSEDFLMGGLQNLKNRLQPLRTGGPSYQDVMKYTEPRLRQIQNLINSKVGQGMLTKEEAAGLERLTAEFGEAQARLFDANRVKKLATGGQKLTEEFYAPRNYVERGGEILGSTVAQGSTSAPAAWKPFGEKIDQWAEDGQRGRTPVDNAKSKKAEALRKKLELKKSR